MPMLVEMISLNDVFIMNIIIFLAKMLRRNYLALLHRIGIITPISLKRLYQELSSHNSRTNFQCKLKIFVYWQTKSNRLCIVGNFNCSTLGSFGMVDPDDYSNHKIICQINQQHQMMLLALKLVQEHQKSWLYFNMTTWHSKGSYSQIVKGKKIHYNTLGSQIKG